MGCRLTTGVQPPGPRRRLSIENLDGGRSDLPPGMGSFSEGGSALLAELAAKDLVDMCGAGGRKHCISSQTDDLSHTSFGSKTTFVAGDLNVDLAKHGLGYACKKGLKPESPNQDSFIICVDNEEYSVYGVFDGHGRKGHDISNFVKEIIPKVLAKDGNVLADPIGALREAFGITQRLIEHATSTEQLDATRSGCTASVILHDHARRKLYIAHVGDSRCVLARKDPATTAPEKMWQAVDLTVDHKPNLPEEQQRIERNGGQVRFDGASNYRVYAKGQRYPGLNMSRAMGDLLGVYHAGISSVPDVVEKSIAGEAEAGAAAAETKPEEPRAPARPSWSKFIPGVGGARAAQSAASYGPTLSTHCIDPLHDKFVLLCSDGVWEFLTSHEAVQLVAQYPAEQAMGAAEQLACISWDRWIQVMQGDVVDDITALVVHLDAPAL
mmetsp:Transcript_17491/g.49623  ORF Transcript_17491/g.49623 Transcript_17491/m.49623 type:complete len:439 (+) Transcript_17491:77-1393(+)